MSRQPTNIIMAAAPLIGAMLAAAACGRSPDAVPTVEYYQAHIEERQARVRLCADDPGQLRDAPSCVNAREAARMEDIGRLHDLPPMGLPGAPASAAPKPPTPRN
jgi:hypothetical protein